MMAICTTNLHTENWHTYIPKPEEQVMSKLKFNPVLGHTAWRWPETQAFLKRLGLDMEAPTTNVTIKIPVDGLVVINHEVQGQDTKEE